MKKKNENILPFLDEVQKAKTEFKQMIDQMSEEDFYSFLYFVELSMNADTIDETDAYYVGDEGWEDEAERFYEESRQSGDALSGEMINFKCTDCRKFSALPIEFIHEIYEENHKPTAHCFFCEKELSPTYYVAPDGKIFKS